MPKCKECGKWFLTQRKLNWHYDEEHFFPKRDKRLREEKEERDENMFISTGIPFTPIVMDNDNDDERVRGGGGEFSGGGASGDWGGDSGSDADCSCDSSSCDCGSSD